MSDMHKSVKKQLSSDDTSNDKPETRIVSERFTSSPSQSKFGEKRETANVPSSNFNVAVTHPLKTKLTAQYSNKI